MLLVAVAGGAIALLLILGVLAQINTKATFQVDVTSSEFMGTAGDTLSLFVHNSQLCYGAPRRESRENSSVGSACGRSNLEQFSGSISLPKGAKFRANAEKKQIRILLEPPGADQKIVLQPVNSTEAKRLDQDLAISVIISDQIATDVQFTLDAQELIIGARIPRRPGRFAGILTDGRVTVLGVPLSVGVLTKQVKGVAAFRAQTVELAFGDSLNIGGVNESSSPFVGIVVADEKSFRIAGGVEADRVRVARYLSRGYSIRLSPLERLAHDPAASILWSLLGLVIGSGIVVFAVERIIKSYA